MELVHYCGTRGPDVPNHNGATGDQPVVAVTNGAAIAALEGNPVPFLPPARKKCLIIADLMIDPGCDHLVITGLLIGAMQCPVVLGGVREDGVGRRRLSSLVR